MNRIFTAVQEDKEEILALYRTFLYSAAEWNEYYPNEETIEYDLSRATPHKDHLLDFARILLASFPSYRPKTP